MLPQTNGATGGSLAVGKARRGVAAIGLGRREGHTMYCVLRVQDQGPPIANGEAATGRGRT